MNAMSDYHPAELTSEQIGELQRMESQLRETTSQDIILIAYEKNAITRQESVSK